MDGAAIQIPVVTALDAVTQAVAALCYLTVGAAAWVRAPRDVRTRVFLGLAVANAVAFAVPAAAWMSGTTDFTKLSRASIAAMLAALSVGALLLFHFTQVLPRRRPWLRHSGMQLPVAYVLVPAAVVGLVWFFPRDIAGLTGGYVLALLVFGFPLGVLLGLVLPVAAIVSLVKSYQEVRADGQAGIARAIAWIVISQIAGGTLAIVFAPVLAVVAPNSASQTSLTIVIWLLGLVMPVAFGAAIWKYRLLAIEADAVT